MPTSDPVLLTPVIRQILQIQPKSVLDIGVGCGKWGALTREYTDIWYRRWDRKNWHAKIDGIEIWRNYKTPLWQWYDDIIIGDAITIINQLQNYDLIICIEVLEHIPKDLGRTFISDLLKHCKILLISFTNSEQGPAFGNKYETHVSRWDFNDFSKISTSEQLLVAGNTQLIKMKC